MSDMTLKKTRFHDGLWEGVLTGATGSTAPVLTAHWAGHSDAPDVQVGPDSAGKWLVRVVVPRGAISDGVHSFSIRDADGVTLCRFDLAVGDALEDDVRAEVAALRAEVDVLASALRKLARGQQG